MNKNLTYICALSLGALVSSMSFGEVSFKGIQSVPFDKDVASTLNKGRNTANREKNYAAAIDLTLKLIAMEQNITNVHRERMNIANTVKNSIKDSKNAFDLYMEIFADKVATPDQRSEGARNAADLAVRELKDNSLYESIIKEALQLPVSTTERARMVLGLGWYYKNTQKKPALAREQFLLIAGDGNFSADARYDAVRPIIDIDKWDKAKTADEKMAIVPLVKEIIGMEGLSAGRKSDLRNLLLDLAKYVGAKEEAMSFAKEIVEKRENPNHVIAAATYLADRMVQEQGDYVAAEEVLATCYDLEKLTHDNYATIAKEIGNLHILRDDFDGAVLEYNRLPQRNPLFGHLKNHMHRLNIELRKTFFRFEDAAIYAIKVGDKFSAAEILAGNLDKAGEAAKLYKEIVLDGKNSLDLRMRSLMWLYSRNGERNFVDANFMSILGGNTGATNGVKNALAGKLNGYTMSANYEDAERVIAHLETIYKLNGEDPTVVVGKRMVLSAAGIGDLALAGARAKRMADILEKSGKYDAKEYYRFRMAEALFGAKGDQKALTKAAIEADKTYKKEIPNKERAAIFNQLGSLSSIANNETLTRAVKDALETLYKKGERRSYVVKYSQKPVLGIESFAALGLEKAEMNRAFEQNMDFLDTDVATGNRGEGIGSEKAKDGKGKPMMEIVSDDYGIHFLFINPDDRALEVKAGLVGGGGYEGYVAPGENQPYTCLLFNIAPNAKCDFFNTTYDTMGHRRIDENDKSLCKSETFFTENAVYSYMALSWNAYATIIPEKGSEWDFENVLWGRSGAPAWNGTESIHGRSTWGKLIFDLSPEARASILKGVIYAAYKNYKREFTTNHGGEGIVDYWKDGEIGDVAFYEECVKPLVEKIAEYDKLVTFPMDDATAVKLSEEALPLWRDFRYHVSKMRSRYLTKKFLQ